MFDTILKRVPWVVAAVMALAVTGQAALAGTDDGIGPSAVANVNADQVDGRHAVKYTSDIAARAKRLMAFGGTGYLPSNIVQGGVATLDALRATTGAVNEADNLVHWNQIFGVPPAVTAGDTTVTILGPTATIAGGANGFLVIGYPANRNVFYELYPVTAGGGIVTIGDLIVRSADSTTFGKAVTFTNASATTPVTVGVRLTSFNPGYVSPAKVKDFITAKFMDKLPKRFRQ